MKDDPIVAEVRRIRDQYARKFNYDVKAIFADQIARQEREDPSHPLVKSVADWIDSGKTQAEPKTLEARKR